MVTNTCERCGIKFEAKRRDKRFCAPCDKKYKSEMVMFYRGRKHPEVQVGVGSGGHSNNRGTTHGSYTTGIMAYRSMVTYDKCNRCDSTENLMVHHIDENRHNNVVENLEVLCRRCHQKHHMIRDPKTGRYIGKSKQREH